MVNSALVKQFSWNVIPEALCGEPTQRKFTSTTKTVETAHLVTKSNTSDREGVREVFFSQDFNNDAADILMASWRKGSFSDYSVNWLRFHLVTRFHQLDRQFRLH